MKSRKNGKLIRLVEIGLTLIKNLIHNIAAFVGITIAITAYDFVIGNIERGIIDSAFGIGGVVFLARMRQTRQRHYSSRAEYRETRQQRYREAEITQSQQVFCSTPARLWHEQARHS